MKVCMFAVTFQNMICSSNTIWSNIFSWRNFVHTAYMNVIFLILYCFCIYVFSVAGWPKSDEGLHMGHMQRVVDCSCMAYFYLWHDTWQRRHLTCGIFYYGNYFLSNCFKMPSVIRLYYVVQVFDRKQIKLNYFKTFSWHYIIS